jgi:5-methylcytosine-specific restriction enzyme A
MAQQAKKICCYAGCGTLTYARYCSRHAKPEYTRSPDYRGSAASRGYDAKWNKLRNIYIMHNPLCVHCEAQGKTKAAQDIDHRLPFQGIDDPLRLDWDNLQSLCRQCHSRKTARDNAGHTGRQL